MSTKRTKYSVEFKRAAVQEVIDRSRPIADVATELGLVAQTLGNWVKAYRDEHPDAEPDLSLPERARFKELERENRELRMENEFLGKGAPRARRSNDQNLWIRLGGVTRSGAPSRG